MVVKKLFGMARRRKGAVRRTTKSVKLPTKKNKKKINGLSEYELNGILTHCISEVQESKNIKMCYGDLQSVGGDNVHQQTNDEIQPLSTIHKKFGRFCLQDVVENENTIPPDPSDVKKVVITTSHEEDPVNEVVIEQQEFALSNEEQVVWADEFVGDMIVCGGVEVEVGGDSRSQDDLDCGSSSCSENDDVTTLRDICYQDCDVGIGDEKSKVVKGTCLDTKVLKNACDKNCEPKTSQSLLCCFESSTTELESVHSQESVNCGEVETRDSEIIRKCTIASCTDNNISGNASDLISSEIQDNDQFLVHLSVSEEEVKCESNYQSDTAAIKDVSNDHSSDVETRIVSAPSEVVSFMKGEVQNTLYYENEHTDYLSNHSPKSFVEVEKTLLSETKDTNQTFTLDQLGSCVNEVTVITEGAETSCDDVINPEIHTGASIIESLYTNKSYLPEEMSGTKLKSVCSRSRSCSTDTTGSESSLNCSLAVRRSNRIRSVDLGKQRSHAKIDEVGSPFSMEKGNEDRMVTKTPENVCTSVSDFQIENINSSVLPFLCSSVQQSADPDFDIDGNKPVKVKSRWRRSSELEMGGNYYSDTDEVGMSSVNYATNLESPSVTNGSINSAPNSSLAEATDVLTTKKDIRNEKKEREEREMEERLRNYVTIYENEYLTERSTSKEAKRMVCDCFLTKEELARGDMGCGEDCLNRLLMIECGSRCAMGERCTNKRFQKHEYAKCDVFKTEKKGFGLRTLDDLSGGAFIMEYVGEVLSPKEFRRRAKDYAKEKNRHYYFMALKSDSIIDATVRGNASRFINHSCEPNAETQKWTVNGELRIGFFTKRNVSAGEEITFDYQFQRYGKEAQRCLCDSTNCRGWIGEDPEKEKRERKQKKEKEIKKKREEKKRDVKEYFDDMDLEEEIEKLIVSGLKNRTHTLTLCRLMVRAEDFDSRTQLLKLIQDGEPACRRLFLDYHGLRLMWSWMVDVASDKEKELSLKMEILHTLVKLPIPNKTVLQDSKVLFMVHKWLGGVKTSGSIADRGNEMEVEDPVSFNIVKKARLLVEYSVNDQDIRPTITEGSIVKPSVNDYSHTKPRTDGLLPNIDYDETIQDIENEKQVVDSVTEIPETSGMIKRSTESDDEGFGEAPEKTTVPEEVIKDNGMNKLQLFADLACKLLSEWSRLKEVFRIPKKERIEQMKEHEREADRGYKEYLDKGEQLDKQSYDRHWRQDRFHSEYEKGVRKRSRDSPDPERVRKISRTDDSTRTLVPVPKLSKEERRLLFALRVAREEEEERQRRQQQELWQQNDSQSVHLRAESDVATPTSAAYPCYFDPSTNTWQPLSGQDYNLTPSEMGSRDTCSSSGSMQHFAVSQTHPTAATTTTPVTISPHCLLPTVAPPPYSQAASHSGSLTPQASSHIPLLSDEIAPHISSTSYTSMSSNEFSHNTQMHTQIPTLTNSSITPHRLTTSVTSHVFPATHGPSTPHRPSLLGPHPQDPSALLGPPHPHGLVPHCRPQSPNAQFSHCGSLPHHGPPPPHGPLPPHGPPPPHSPLLPHGPPLPSSPLLPHGPPPPHGPPLPRGPLLPHGPRHLGPPPRGPHAPHGIRPPRGPLLPHSPFPPHGPPTPIGMPSPHGFPPPHGLSPNQGPPIFHGPYPSYDPPLPPGPAHPHGLTPTCETHLPNGSSLSQTPPQHTQPPLPFGPPLPHGPHPSPVPLSPLPACGPTLPQGPPAVQGTFPSHVSPKHTLTPTHISVSNHCPVSVHGQTVPSVVSPSLGQQSHCSSRSPHQDDIALQPAPHIAPQSHLTPKHSIKTATCHKMKRSPLLPTPPHPFGPLHEGFPNDNKNGNLLRNSDATYLISEEGENLPFHRRIQSLPPTYGDKSSSPCDQPQQTPYGQPSPHTHTFHNPLQKHSYHAYPVGLPVQQPFTPTAPPPFPLRPIRLPPKWKSAKDAEGRVYYYHVKTRISQWEPPQWTQIEQQPDSESSTSTSEDDDDDEDEDDDEDDETSSSDEEEEEEDEDDEDNNDEEEEEPEADETELEDKTDTNKIKEDEAITEEKPDTHEDDIRTITTTSGVASSEELSTLLEEEEEMCSKLCLDDEKKKEKRREGLVQERIISPRRAEDKSDNRRYKEIKEKLKKRKELALSRQHGERSKKHHRDSKSHSSGKSSEKPMSAAADTSSDTARRIKDQFRLQMASVMVQYLNPYRKPECQKGRITNTEDFKHLARKLTHFVMVKELKHCRKVEDLICNDNVKHKARDFVKKYMAKFGSVYQRPKDEEQ